MNACNSYVLYKIKPRREYFINIGSTRAAIDVSECERDLGVMVSSDGRWTAHINLAVASANKILGLMKHTFRCYNNNITKIVYPVCICQVTARIWIARLAHRQPEGIKSD
jgi:hypothetical protein